MLKNGYEINKYFVAQKNGKDKAKAKAIKFAVVKL
jgi:hypothetical protein